jgi:hypothetical protein
VAREQVPRLDDLQAAAITALLGDLTGAERDAVELHAHRGRYGDVVRGLRSQASIVRNSWVRELMAKLLPFAEGQALIQLADSEFFARLPNLPQKAVGHVFLSRTVTNESALTTGNFTARVIKAGHTFHLLADPLARPPLQGADYEATEAVTTGVADTGTFPGEEEGEYIHVQTISVPIRATRTGPHANTPSYDEEDDFYVGSSSGLPTSDPIFVVGQLVAAGGTDGPVDEQLRALARAMAVGRGGPTNFALLAGALASVSVRHVATFTDYTTAVQRLFLADESWASSDELGQDTRRKLSEAPWIGWGCRVSTGLVVNRRIVVRATVILRSAEYEDARPAITQSILKALRAYFDDRPDFWTFDVESIGGVISGADTRVMACTSAAVEDTDREALTAPAALIPDDSTEITHFALVGDALDLTFTLPAVE